MNSTPGQTHSPLALLHRHRARRLSAPPPIDDATQNIERDREPLAPDFALFETEATPDKQEKTSPVVGKNAVTNSVARVNLNLETPQEEWKPRSLGIFALSGAQWPPLRFVASEDNGRCVAWLCTRHGFPVPVRVAQIGAVSLRANTQNARGETVLRRDWSRIERVVALEIDAFPWPETEAFAIALQEHGFRLLPVATPVATPDDRRDGNAAHVGERWDFARAVQRTNDRTRDESLRLERQSIVGIDDAKSAPLWIDGPLMARRTAFETGAIVAGVVAPRGDWLHPQGWRAFYNLQNGQRTPAFAINDAFPVWSWYLRLHAPNDDTLGAQWSGGNGLGAGVVRLEVPVSQSQPFNAKRVDELSRWLLLYRERGGASGTTLPLQRAAHALESSFAPLETIIAQFLRLTQL